MEGASESQASTLVLSSETNISFLTSYSGPILKTMQTKPLFQAHRLNRQKGPTMLPSTQLLHHHDVHSLQHVVMLGYRDICEYK